MPKYEETAFPQSHEQLVFWFWHLWDVTGTVAHLELIGRGHIEMLWFYFNNSPFRVKILGLNGLTNFRKCSKRIQRQCFVIWYRVTL